ncbi:MAG TPA: hypothetical protein VEI02_12105 [Planctomycetota bacterium]|nr:hypothetical protein [Planctomycetota bacterium]
MSQIARVFAVLNLVLAAGFLFAAGTFLGTKADYIAQLNTEKDAHRATEARLQAELTKRDADIANLTTNNAGLREQKSTLEATIAGQKAQLEANATELSNKNVQITNLTNDIASLTDVNRRQGDDKNRLVEENNKLRTDIAAAQAAEREAKAAETLAKSTIIERENTIAQNERDLTSSKNRIHELDLQVDWARGQGLDFTKFLKMEPIHDARVIAYDSGMKLAQFNVGSKQGVARGYTFDVVRGDRYIGRVVIDQVYENTSAGKLQMAAEGQAPMVGDRGTTTL